MVLSFNIPLKPSDEAIVKFLMGLVFGSKKINTPGNRRECLRHDIIGANKLIFWILENDKKNRKSFSSVCNLVYGNTLVLSSQVARLLYDAIRAKEIVAYSSFNALEEERKRKTREQIEEALQNDENATPKKKKRSKRAEDDFLLASPVLISQALRQNITMPDVASIQKEQYPFPEDDLAPVTEQQFEMLYGLLDPIDRPSSATIRPSSERDRTFIERYSSNENHQRSRFDEMEFDLQAPSRDFIDEQYHTPRKSTTNIFCGDEQFEPTPRLAEILMYGKLPILSEDERRKSLEDEMEEARSRAINGDQQTPIRQDMDYMQNVDFTPQMDFTRIPSEIELEKDILIPNFPKTPRSAAKNRRSGDADMDAINNRVPLRDMHHRMEDFSSLHYKDSTPLLARINLPMTLKELMDPVPIQFRKRANMDLCEPFRVAPHRHEKGVGNDVSDEESEVSFRKNRPSDVDLEPLEPINLSQMKIMSTPLKDRTPPESPQRRPEFEFREEFEYPRNSQERFDKSVTPGPEFNRLDAPVLFEDFDVPSRNEIRSPTTGSGNQEITPSEQIREKVIEECKKAAPFAYNFDNMFPFNTTRREAARTFYVVLELLKEHQIIVGQKGPFDSIEVSISSTGSEDLEDIVDQ